MLGRAEEIGSGVKNLYKYTKIYIEDGKPVLFEDDVFKTEIPLTNDAVKHQKKKYELSEREEYIKQEILKNKKITVDQIAKSLGVNRRTILRTVQEMKGKIDISYDKKTGEWSI